MMLASIAAVGLAAAVCAGFYWREADRIDQNWRVREAVRVRMFGNLIRQDFNFISSNLLALADGDGLQSYLVTGTPADLDRATRRAVFYSRQNPAYDQVRFLDEHGQEVIRVDQGGAVVPPGSLQNRANRPYFTSALALKRGQVFISSFDLAIENGRIEQPLKPLVRFATPVFDASGRLRGVYVVNYRGAEFIARMLKFVPTYQHRLRILDGRGYWLKAADPAQEWGFVFPERESLTLTRSDPALWKAILSTEEGLMQRNGGLFSWYRFDPSQAFADGRIKSGDSFLLIASEISAPEWDGFFASLRQSFLIVTVVLAVLLLASLWFLHERAKAQRELDRFFTLTHDLLCIAGFDGYFKRLNPAWHKTFGFTVEEMKARPFIEFIHPDDREATLAQAARQAEGFDTGSYENRYLCKDGSYRWLQWNARPMPNEQLIFATARDVTAQKKVEQIHLQFRSLFESLPGLYLVLQPNLNIVAVSDAYLKATMTRREQLLGKYLFDLFPGNPDDPAGTGVENLRNSLQRVLQSSAPDTMAIQRYDVRRPDGVFEERYWSPINSPVLGADAHIEYIIHRVEDVTDFVRKKMAVPDGSQGFQSRDDLMEAEIYRSSQQVQATNQQLQAVNAELEAFSYSVSHDLRAPLRHIDGFAGLLSKHAVGKLDDKSRRYIEVISEAARKMGRLIDDLLAFSRTGRAQMALARVSQDELVAAVIREGHFDRPENRIQWEILPLPTVYADPAMLRQVWFNFIDNAVKYSSKAAHPRVEIGSQPGPGADEVTCYVRDNGAGFDMRYVDKLFGVFQRLHTEAEFEGTGIGLANIRRIVTRHGGRAWAEGAIGAGATFYFSLPTTRPGLAA